MGKQVSLLISRLTQQMNKASADLEFEDAQKVKRQIEMIQNLLGRYKKFPEEEKTTKQLKQLRTLIVRWQGIDPIIIHRLEAYDVANLGKKITVGSMVVFIEGEPDNALYRQFRIKLPTAGDPGGIKQILKRRR